MILRALLFSHPQVYVDISMIVYAEPRPAFYRYLQGIVEAGYGDRVMFGSDLMIWPARSSRPSRPLRTRHS